MNINYVSVNDLKEAPWRATHVLKPDMHVLAESLIDYGWIAPIIVNQKTSEIIDGYHRWFLSQTDKTLRKRDKGIIPVQFVKCGEVEAMLMHLRLNRGRGEVLAKHMSHIVKDALRSRKYKEDDLVRMLRMSTDELDLMIDGTLIKTKKVAEHKYSKAWVPVEAPANIKEQVGFIERPSTPDR